MAIEPWASLCADKVTSCAPCFIQFVVYSMRNPVVYISDREKSSILLTIQVAM